VDKAAALSQSVPLQADCGSSVPRDLAMRLIGLTLTTFLGAPPSKTPDLRPERPR